MGETGSPDRPLSAHHLVARHRHRTVLYDVSLRLPRGRLVALLGPNASGKSTLVRCLSGAHRPVAGRVTLGDDDIHRLSALQVSRRIAYLPQDTAVAFAFTVAELVGLARAAAPSPGLTPERERAVLERLDLVALRDRSLTTLSGGERQRAAAARAFLQQTDYLILDEPTAHLDLRHQALLLDAARHEARHGGRGVLIVLHDLNLAAAYADHIILLRDGKVAAEGSANDVLTPAVLASVYETNAIVLQDPTTGLPHISVSPSRDLTSS